jgi:hypothetical protein
MTNQRDRIEDLPRDPDYRALLRLLRRQTRERIDVLMNDLEVQGNGEQEEGANHTGDQDGPTGPDETD